MSPFCGERSVTANWCDNRVPAQQTKPQKKEAEKEKRPLRTGGFKGRPSEQSNAKSALGPKAWQAGAKGSQHNKSMPSQKGVGEKQKRPQQDHHTQSSASAVHDLPKQAKDRT